MTTGDNGGTKRKLARLMLTVSIVVGIWLIALGITRVIPGAGVSGRLWTGLVVALTLLYVYNLARLFRKAP
jgi:hypothetical protein